MDCALFTPCTYRSFIIDVFVDGESSSFFSSLIYCCCCCFVDTIIFEWTYNCSIYKHIIIILFTAVCCSVFIFVRCFRILFICYFRVFIVVVNVIYGLFCTCLSIEYCNKNRSVAVFFSIEKNCVFGFVKCSELSSLVGS